MIERRASSSRRVREFHEVTRARALRKLAFTVYRPSAYRRYIHCIRSLQDTSRLSPFSVNLVSLFEVLPTITLWELLLMQALEASLKTLLGSLPHGPDKRTLDSLVAETLATTKSKSPADIRKNQWEYVLKNEIFTLAVRATSPSRIPHTARKSDA